MMIDSWTLQLGTELHPSSLVKSVRWPLPTSSTFEHICHFHNGWKCRHVVHHYLFTCPPSLQLINDIMSNGVKLVHETVLVIRAVCFRPRWDLYADLMQRQTYQCELVLPLMFQSNVRCKSSNHCPSPTRCWHHTVRARSWKRPGNGRNGSLETFLILHSCIFFRGDGTSKFDSLMWSSYRCWALREEERLMYFFMSKQWNVTDIMTSFNAEINPKRLFWTRIIVKTNI